MENFQSDWTFKPITMLHVNAPIVGAVTLVYAKGGVFLLPAPLVLLMSNSSSYLKNTIHSFT